MAKGLYVEADISRRARTVHPGCRRFELLKTALCSHDVLECERDIAQDLRICGLAADEFDRA